MKSIAHYSIALACTLTTVFVGGCRTGSAQADPDSSNSIMLKLAAIAAFQRNDLEEAGVLFLKSQARFQLDRIVYPPAGKGGDDPAVLKSAMSAMLGSSIMNEVHAEPEVFLKVIKRLEKWNPKFPANYDPGWKYLSKIDEKEVANAVAQVREQMLPALRKKATLLADGRYQQAMDVLGDMRNKTKDLFQQLETWRQEQGTEGKQGSNRQTYEEIRSAQAAEERQLLKLFEIEWDLIPESRWHTKVGWKAEDFFDDPKIVELCHAIEKNNLAQMQDLIAEGVDVNAKGKDNMTPLLWSYSDHKFERFQMLLKAGADPNVMATSGFNLDGQKFHPTLGRNRVLACENFGDGSSVNVMAYQAADSKYTWAVLNHGGNVNQIDPNTGQSPLHFVINQFPRYDEKPAMVKALIDKGADLNLPNPYRNDGLPLEMAIKDSAFDLAIIFVESGADPNAKGPSKSSRRPTRLALQKEADIRRYDSARVLKYQELLDVMTKHGGDFKAARADLENGPAWGKARNRQDDLGNLLRRLIVERKYPAGQVHVYDPGAIRYRWSDYNDQQRTWAWSKYYSHVSPDCSRPPHSSAIAFSIKHVPKDEVRHVEESLPEFAALGDKTILVSPSFSGHPNWLDSNGDILVDYLRHLVVKKCKLMDRTSTDFPELPHDKSGYYFLEMADDKRHHELLVPSPYLRDEALRRKSGLEKFDDVWKLLEQLKQRSFVGDVQQTGALLSEVNKQLKSTFPDASIQFYIHHLTSANRDASGTLRCTLECSKNAGQTRQIYSASCQRAGDELTIEITRRDDK